MHRLGLPARFVLIPVRFSSQQAVVSQPGNVSKEEGYFKKIALRFKGIPLEGETEKPKSLFDDCDKEFLAPPLPQIPKDYKEFPERDLVNFPYPERYAYPPKTRMFMIPDSWCKPFEKITGTSGPYVFFGSFFGFLLNKEIFVLEENFMKLYALTFIYLILSRAYQFRFDKYLIEKFTEKTNYYKGIIADDLKEAVEFRKTSAAETSSLKELQESFPIIFKENLSLQLEAVYRRNVSLVANELKRRLDYIQEVESTKKLFERDILLKSISEGVLNKITKNEGNIKDNYLDNCIAQLNLISANKS